jgi:hypothetical protein
MYLKVDPIITPKLHSHTHIIAIPSVFGRLFKLRQTVFNTAFSANLGRGVINVI